MSAFLKIRLLRRLEDLDRRMIAVSGKMHFSSLNYERERCFAEPAIS